MTKKAVGIDLGTTNSSMAIVRNGQPDIIQLGTSDDRILRSALYFSTINGKKRVFYGADAINRGTELGRVEDFKQDFKRDMGHHIVNEDPSHTEDSTVLSALLLHRFKKRLAGVALEEGVDSIDDAVITVPAYFTSEQRQETKKAGQLAGFNVLRIINEPTAAAISYANRKDVSGNVLVYDLGGGTFDVTIMTVADHQYHILATDGDHRLGGIDFDKALVKLIKAKFEAQGLNMTMLTAKEEMQLRYQAEKLKTQLSVDEVVYVERFTEAGDYAIEISQEEFRQATSVLVKDTEIKTNQTLATAGLTWDDIDHILLVGGSTRMPVIRQMVREISGKEPRYDLNPDTIVAEGASIIADLIVNDKIDFGEHKDGESTEVNLIQVRDVTSQGIGMLFRKSPNRSYDFVGDYVNSVIVPRNTPIPHSHQKEMFAVANGQDNFRLRVTEGNYENPRDVKVILDTVIQLPRTYQAGQQIGSVAYAFDEEQIITLTVLDIDGQTIIKSYEANAVINQVEVEEDLSDLQEIFDQFVS